jgi:hypothetical protein
VLQRGESDRVRDRRSDNDVHDSAHPAPFSAIHVLTLVLGDHRADT